jgi:hypothetical protein
MSGGVGAHHGKVLVAWVLNWMIVRSLRQENPGNIKPSPRLAPVVSEVWRHADITMPPAQGKTALRLVSRPISL